MLLFFIILCSGEREYQFETLYPEIPAPLMYEEYHCVENFPLDMMSILLPMNV